jgi:hypothetical protein
VIPERIIDKAKRYFAVSVNGNPINRNPSPKRYGRGG